jgi:hypothetical protein
MIDFNAAREAVTAIKQLFDVQKAMDEAQCKLKSADLSSAASADLRNTLIEMRASFVKIHGHAAQTYEIDQARNRAAELQQMANGARSEDDKQSYLAVADSWIQTIELSRLLDADDYVRQHGP